MEQISGNQQQICLLSAGLLNHLTKGIPDLLPSLGTPGILLLWFCSQMYISQMNKTHGSLLFYSFHNSDYRSQFFTVLGNGMTSRIFDMPVRYMTQRSNPRPNPE